MSDLSCRDARPAAECLLGQLLRGLAHEFNNHLHVIANVGAVLRDESTLCDEDAQLLEDLMRSSEAAVECAAALRMLGRSYLPAQGSAELLSSVEGLSFAAETWLKPGQTLESHLPDELPRVAMDAAALDAALAAMLREAIEAAPFLATLSLAASASPDQASVSVCATATPTLAQAEHRLSGQAAQAGGPAVAPVLAAAGFAATRCNGSLTVAQPQPGRLVWTLLLPVA